MLNFLFSARQIKNNIYAVFQFQQVLEPYMEGCDPDLDVLNDQFSLYSALYANTQLQPLMNHKEFNNFQSEFQQQQQQQQEYRAPYSGQDQEVNQYLTYHQELASYEQQQQGVTGFYTQPDFINFGSSGFLEEYVPLENGVMFNAHYSTPPLEDSDSGSPPTSPSLLTGMSPHCYLIRVLWLSNTVYLHSSSF